MTGKVIQFEGAQLKLIEKRVRKLISHFENFEDLKNNKKIQQIIKQAAKNEILIYKIRDECVFEARKIIKNEEDIDKSTFRNNGLRIQYPFEARIFPQGERWCVVPQSSNTIKKINMFWPIYDYIMAYEIYYENRMDKLKKFEWSLTSGHFYVEDDTSIIRANVEGQIEILQKTLKNEKFSDDFDRIF